MKKTFTHSEIQYVKKSVMDDVALPILVEKPQAEKKVATPVSQRSYTLRSALMLSMLSMSIFALLGIQQTFSYFSDIESSTGNTFAAGLLDFIVQPDSFARTIPEGSNVGKYIDPAVTTESGSFNLRYRVQSTFQSGSTAFCNSLQANATTSALTYSGPLIGINVGPTASVGPWELYITMPNATGVHDGDVCNVDLVYKGWVDGKPEGDTYDDIETVHIALTASIPAPVILLKSFAPLNLVSEDPPAEDLSTPPTDPVVVETPPEEVVPPEVPPEETPVETTEVIDPPPADPPTSDVTPAETESAPADVPPEVPPTETP